MSELNREGQGPSPTEQMKADISAVLAVNGQIDSLVSQRGTLMDSIKKNIAENQIPEELKFLITSLINNKRGLEEDVTEDAENLRRLDERLREHSGQMIAWLDVRSEVTVHRDPGPSKMEDMYSFHVGQLPMEPGLVLSRDGSVSINVAKSVRMTVPTLRDVGREITDWQDASVHLLAMLGYPEKIDGEWKIYVSPDYSIGYAGIKAVQLPLPLIGDKAVKALIDNSELQTLPHLASALDMLVDKTLF
jgi:hypothetical protein